MSCSIHLGNYILVVQPPTPRRPDTVGSQGSQAPADGKKGKKGKPTAVVKPVAVKTISMAGQGMGALDFELSWLRFLREAEDDYQKRLCRNDNNKPLSIFDMNIDLFEIYLLKASGRALSSTQHLNLNLTSAMVSHMKLFDTSHPEAASEEEQELEAEEDIAKRRLKRIERRRKRRRITASFNEVNHTGQDQEGEEGVQEEAHVVGREQPLIQQQHAAVQKRPMLDSLNERDERESGEDQQHPNGNVPYIQEEDSHEEFDVNDRSQTIQIDKNLLQQHMLIDNDNRASLNIQDQEIFEQVVVVQQPEKQRPQEEEVNESPIEYYLDASPNIDQLQSQTLRDFRASQLYPDSIIQTDEGGMMQHHQENDNAKIMIGDQSIDDHFADDHTLNLGADGQPTVHNYTEEDELNEDDIDGGNPFRRKSVSFIKEQSIVSQGSIPLDHFGATNNSQNFIATGPSGGFGMDQLGGTLESLNIPVKAKDDFDQYKTSPSMPEIHADGSGLMHHVLQHDLNMIDALVTSPYPSPKRHEIVQEVVLSTQPTIHVGPIEEPPLVWSHMETPTLPQEKLDDYRPTTAQATLIQPAILPEEAKKASIIQEPPLVKSPPPKIELKEFVQQTSFREEKEIEEPEVVMRFEVAVGTTPQNQSVGSVGNMSMEQAVQSMHEQKVVERTLNESSIHRAMEEDIHHSRGRPSPNTSVERGAPAGHHSRSRLEVTLTAEPDKPIMVEVRGGEKQFLISALTKHIYDILSQPHKLQLGYNQRESEGDSQYGQEEENEEEDEEEYEDQVKQIKIGKNLNLKLKSLKKNLKKVPLLSSQSEEMNAITIEHLDQSSKLIDDNTPQKNSSAKKSPLNESKHQQQMMIQQNWPNAVGKSSSRSSIGMSLTPLTVAPGEENVRVDHHHQQLTAPPQRRTERFALHEVRYDQISKRTTEEAYADAKIREEVRLTQIFDSETANSMIGTQARRETMGTAQENNRKHTETLASSMVQPPPSAKLETRRKPQNSLQQVQVMSDEVVMTNYPMVNRSSRPETATFNNEHPLMHIPSQTELPPINMKSSQLSNRLLQGQQQQQPRTPKYHPGGSMLNMNSSTHNLVPYEEEIIYTEKPTRASRRAQTPDDNHQQSIIDDNGEMGPPVEVEQFSLPPLQPTIPMPHPNGYFGSEAGGDYMILNRQDSQNYILMTAATNGETDDQQQVPQVNYYDAYTTGGMTQGENGYYQYSPNGYPEPSEQEATPEEYILAEGYLLHFKEARKQAEVAGVVERQVYDLSRNQPPPPQQQQHSHPHNQPKGLQRQGTNTQNERSGYPPHYPNNSKKAPKLPVVPTKKRVLGSSAQGANMIYGLNGGPAYRTLPYTPVRSLSPLRRKNFVHYTANIGGASQTQQQQIEQYQQQSTIMAAPHQFQEVAYYSQSPQPNRMRPSPYLSDDEFKILHDFYDIQCEPTGLHRGGVPLMRVKRINRPLNNAGVAAAAAGKRTYNIFNFAEELAGAGNSTLQPGQQQSMSKSSLQIFYPQYQPNSPFKQDYLMSRTLATPSKWFDRFYQSTRNLNQTISNLHKQHNRKLRSYSVTSLTSGEQVVQNTIGGGGVRDSGRAVVDQIMFQKHVEGQVDATRDSIPVTEGGRYQNEMSTTHSSTKPIKKTSASVKSGATNAAVFMPPLHKIYSANMSHDQATALLQTAAERNKKQPVAGKLPPRPVGGGSIFKQNTVPGDHKTSGAAPVIIPPAILSAGSNGGVSSAATQ